MGRTADQEGPESYQMGLTRPAEVEVYNSLSASYLITALLLSVTDGRRILRHCGGGAGRVQ